MSSPEAQLKKEMLVTLLRALGRVAVAFSGGVDSTFLAVVAHETLDGESVAVTVDSPLTPECDRADALETVRKYGMRHIFIELDELRDKTFASNPPDRCYVCKKMRFERMAAWAGKQGIAWVLDGSNVDDTHDYRPGMKALSEIPGVRSPLLEVGLAKEEIRQLSREMNLFTWDKPAAACLASRLPYVEVITEEKLNRIEAAEAFLATLLPPRSQFRVRAHADLARLEMDLKEALRILPDQSEKIYATLKNLGFRYVTLDLIGYRTGSLNETLTNSTPPGPEQKI